MSKSNVKPPSDPVLAAQATEVMSRPISWNAAKASQREIWKNASESEAMASMVDWMTSAPEESQTRSERAIELVRRMHRDRGLRRHGNGKLARAKREEG